MSWWVVQKGQQVACSSGRAPWEETGSKKMGPRKHGDNGGVARRERRSAEGRRAEAKRSTVWGICSRSREAHDCMYNGRRDQRAKNPHGFLGPSSQHPVSSIQHPASNARQPCATQGGFLRGRGSMRAAQQESDAPGALGPRSPLMSRLSHRRIGVLGAWVGGNTARGGGGGPGASSPVDPSSNLSQIKPLSGPSNP